MSFIKFNYWKQIAYLKQKYLIYIYNKDRKIRGCFNCQEEFMVKTNQKLSQSERQNLKHKLKNDLLFVKLDNLFIIYQLFFNLLHHPQRALNASFWISIFFFFLIHHHSFYLYLIINLILQLTMLYFLFLIFTPSILFFISSVHFIQPYQVNQN